MVMKASYDRTHAPSKSFRWSNPATIAPGAEVRVSWEAQDTTSKKYLPFNFTRIVNNAGEDVTFYPNQDTTNAFTVPAGTIITMDRQSVPAVSSFTIVNDDSTNTIQIGEVVVSNSREGVTTDSFVQRLHRRLSRG